MTTSSARRSAGITRRITWVLFAALSFAVAGYAFSIVLRPQISPLAAQLTAAQPWLAPLHFAAGGVALAVGVLQFITRLRLRRPAMHRWAGRIYVIAVLGSGSAGLVLAIQTSAGSIAAVGFGALAVLWLATTLQAYRAIRARQVAQHRVWMMRSFALTLAAVTLRFYLPMSQIAGLSFTIAYPVIAWLCWVPNLALAELLSRRTASSVAA
jgi:uncharacterized membrane protein